MGHRLEEFGGSGQSVVFAHANGFPPGSYRQLLARLAAQCRVTAIHHRPLWGEREPPARLHWRLFADDLIEGLEARGEVPAWLLGHSLGAVVGLLAAERRPELFRGLLLLDPVFLPTRFVAATALTPRGRLQRLPMIRRALARPEAFADAEAAFAFYRGKRAFQAFDDDALRDYVKASLEPVEEEQRLRFPAAWEAAIYGSAPWVWPRLRRVELPVLGVRGERSDTLSAPMFRRWGRLQSHAELHTIPGGHLFPMEAPHATAELVLDFLARQGG
jgi:pimeloyl-ACP methyl ester carboxylesterase